MKLVSFSCAGEKHLGFINQDRVFPLNRLEKRIPITMQDFLRDWDFYLNLAKQAEQKVKVSSSLLSGSFAVKEVHFAAPVPNPASLRDGYAFRQHVEAARRNRNLPMIPAFDEFPIFYFGNHQTVCGPGIIECMPDHFEKLDFELEVAIVICKRGKNIPAGKADEYIGGLMIMNDLSARTLQIEEMQLNLGPAKGKDFSTSTGPWLLTPDELMPFEVTPKENHVGKSWNLKMTASVNGIQISSGNLAEMDWTFAEIIERASYGVDLYPGDIIGSGTVGTGCFLEVNGTARFRNSDHPEKWLQPGDEISLAVEQLGELQNIVIECEGQNEYSILQIKKNNVRHVD